MNLVLALLVLAVAAWAGYLAYLTAREDRACGEASDTKLAVSPPAMQHVLDEYSTRERGVGLQATVILRDGTTWHAVSGYASLEKRCPMTADHHLYIGSMTKLFTAVLVMRQVEQNVLSLDDTLDAWLPLPYADTVTLRMLLNHTSGIPDYTQEAWFLARYMGLPSRQWRADDLVSVIAGKPLEFAPGSRHKYSNSNYVLLGLILEKVTGKPYGVLLRDAVANKLGLRDVAYLDYPETAAIANAYDKDLLHLGRRNLTGFRRSLESGAFAAGGIVATSADVARFVHALFGDRLVAGSTLAQMKTFVEAPDEDMPTQTGYGLGLRRLELDGHVFVGHTGSIPGYSGIAMHDEQSGCTIVILSNLSMIEQTQLLMQMRAMIDGR